MLHFLLCLQQSEVFEMNLLTLLHRQILYGVRIGRPTCFLRQLTVLLRLILRLLLDLELRLRSGLLLLNQLSGWLLIARFCGRLRILVRIDKLLLGDFDLGLFFLRSCFITLAIL